MISPEKIRAILFDYGATLADDVMNYGVGFAQMCTAAGYPMDVAVYHSASEAAKITVGDPPPELTSYRVWRDKHLLELLKEIGVAKSDVEAISDRVKKRFRYYSRPQCFAETHFVLKSLRWAGYTVGIISNIPPALPDALKDTGIDKHLHFAIASDTFGISKPDPEIFEEGLRLAGVSAEECVYVGDSVEADVEGSMPLGIQPVLIDRAGIHHERDGVLKISNLVELLDWLGVDPWNEESLHDQVCSRIS